MASCRDCEREQTNWEASLMEHLQTLEMKTKLTHLDLARQILEDVN